MNEPFVIEGFWWLPNTPDVKIPGVLSVTPGDTPRLKLMGALNNIEERDFPPPDFINPDIIHGISAKGESVTLSQCLQKSQNSSIGDAGSQKTSEFIAHFAFFGVYFSNLSDIQFTSVSVRFHNLDNWYNKSCIKTSTPGPGTEVITFKRPDPIDIQINDYLIQITILESQSLNLNHTLLSAKVYINISNDTKKPLEEYLNLLRLIQNFFTFAITVPTFVIDIIGRVTEKIEPTSTNFNPPLTIKIFYDAAGWQPDPPDFFWAFMLLPYSEIEGNLPGLLKMWVEKAETLKPVYDLYFAGIYRSTYPENEFLNLTQAIESFHRRIYGGEYIPENTYLNGLYKILTDAIPQDISADFRSSLQKGKLRYAHEYSLRKRIFLLCQHISENLRVNFLNDKKAQSDYAERIADTRNYLTHYSPELKEKAITGGKELFELNNQLELFISFCFLEQLEIPYNKIEALLYKDRRYQRYISKSLDSGK